MCQALCAGGSGHGMESKAKALLSWGLHSSEANKQRANGQVCHTLSVVKS